MLTDGQFRVRKGKACVTNLLNYYDRVAETVKERDGWVDLKKTFDRVPKEGLV